MYSSVLIIMLGVVITRTIKLQVNREHTNWKNELVEYLEQFIATVIIFAIIMTLLS
jgi:hypothetical protein